ncbi:MAG: ABC transporter ATP-binding protein, partial [Peptostreptococcaceae bacterium]
DFVSIVGASGSGKSKLLHLLGGLEKTKHGEIFINEKNILKMKDRHISKVRRDEIGFVFQDFILEENKTAIQNVSMPLKFLNLRNKTVKEKSNDILDRVGLSEHKKNKVNVLSGGQRQKVAIARALVSSPNIILADEPTGNLDSKNAKVILELLRDLNKSGYTILMVTHNLEQTIYSNKVIAIKDGEIINVIEKEKDEKMDNTSNLLDKIESSAENCINANIDTDEESIKENTLNAISKGVDNIDSILSKLDEVKKELKDDALLKEKEVEGLEENLGELKAIEPILEESKDNLDDNANDCEYLALNSNLDKIEGGEDNV